MAETSYREWFWGATAVTVTIIAFISWGLLFVLAGVMYAIWVYKAPWFGKKPPSTRAGRKKAIVLAIFLGLFLFWWLVPQPDVVKIISEAFHPAPGPTPTPLIAAAATPLPTLTNPRPRKTPLVHPSETPAASSSSLSTPQQQSGQPFYLGTPFYLPTVSGGLLPELTGSSVSLNVTVTRSLLSDKGTLGLHFISDATVVVREEQTGREFREKTNELGNAHLYVSSGSYFITVEHSGYKSSWESFTVAKSDIIKNITIWLTPLESASP